VAITMAKIVLSMNNAILREVTLSKERVTIGRRPQNDIVIDSAAVSAEHAAIVTHNNDSFLEDLNSINGTQINGQPVKKHFLQNGDVIELAEYKMRYLADEGANSDGLTGLRNMVPTIRVLNGPHSGKEIALTKTLTTIGKPGEQVAVITKQMEGYFITHIEGDTGTAVNGESIGADTRELDYGDVISLSGTLLAFLRA
jgi:pSer/pThr/pTyr-binding forkhead associated (FHA) protein